MSSLTALGGMTITTTVEGLERYPVNLRYPRELRDNLPALKQTLVATPSRRQVPLGQLANIEIARGPDMIRSENARLSSWVYVDIAGPATSAAWINHAKQAVDQPSSSRPATPSSGPASTSTCRPPPGA